MHLTLGRHNEHIQSMRGLAALIVLVGHAQLVITIVLQVGAISLFLPLHAAVLFFFVLSGYVLGESIRRHPMTPTSVLAYFWKRVRRLFPVYWLAVLLGATTYIAIERPPIPGVTEWLNGAFAGGQSVTLGNVAPNLWAQTVSMNGALWSVQVEIFMIPLLPVMVAICARTAVAVDLAILAALTVLAAYQIDGPTTATPWSFVAYMNCFYLGVMLPKLMRGPAAAMLADRAVFAVSLALTFALTAAVHIEWISFAAKKMVDVYLSAELIAFIVLNPRSRPATILGLRPLVWLGDMSYSFYAYGTPILMLSATAWLSVVPLYWLAHYRFALPLFVVIVSTATALTAAVAWLSYALIGRQFLTRAMV